MTTAIRSPRKRLLQLHDRPVIPNALGRGQPRFRRVPAHVLLDTTYERFGSAPRRLLLCPSSVRKDGGTAATLLDNLSPSVCDVRHQTEVNLRHFRTGQN